MPPYQKIRLRKDRGVTNCKTCGFPIRVVRRGGGSADHYEYLDDLTLDQVLAHQDPETAAKLREMRKGKKTIAMVGRSPASCALAPFDDPDVEIWSLNETHGSPWMERWDRWFQMHPRKSFVRDVDQRGITGHFDWLREKHGKPIYMLFTHMDIPDGVEYPLAKVKERFFKDMMWQGDDEIEQLGSTFDYMIALALLENEVERIEIYGFDMAAEGMKLAGYVYQKPGALFWLGVARGMDVEIYTPPSNQLFMAPLYGYKWFPE